ncbi:hypothetical protein QUF80_14190 [Desulfococcaceae bacterium HSG8]|nr:hypothetical protein [Desulfococcaceae bacterium HSG8]
MLAKTIDSDSITAYTIWELTKKLSPSDLQWLIRQLGNVSDKQDSENLNSEIFPSPEVMARLDIAVGNHDRHTYRGLMDQTDWHSAPADVLDQAIGLAISFGDMKRGKELIEPGLSRFPEHKQIARTSLLFNPRPARVVKKAWRPPETGSETQWNG